MRISTSDLEYYRSTLHGIGEQAASYVRDSIEMLGEGAGVTAMRETAIDALMESVGIHGEMSQALAGQLFDEVCDAEGLGALEFEMLDDIIDFDMLEEKVRYLAGSLVEGNGDKFLDDCSVLADFYVRRCNYESMVRNCYGNNVRYARIPTGAETCHFCIMLASRGFVYHNKDTATHEVHMHCDCIAVPGVDGKTAIEGYDPKALYDQWRGMVNDKAKSRAERNGTTVKQERDAIMASYAQASSRAKQRARLKRY